MNLPSKSHFLAAFQDVDTTVIKLSAKDHPNKVSEFVNLADFSGDYEDCKTVLEETGRFHFLGLLHVKNGQYEPALAIWCSILEGKTQDEAFPGLKFFTTHLRR